MCGRFTSTKSKDDLKSSLADRLGIGLDGEEGFERFNVSPSQEIVSVVQDGGGRRMKLLRWGLVPSWAKDVKTGFKMINARAETVHDRRAYRSLVRQGKHRCLIVADGYYEWIKPEDPKQPRKPMHFSLADGAPFCFAGLWTLWTSPEDEVVPSCTILTTHANDVVRPIHDRMPVLLCEPEEWEAWLDPELTPDDLKTMLAPVASDRLVVRPANPIVNNARHEGPDCLVAPAA